MKEEERRKGARFPASQAHAIAALAAQHGSASDTSGGAFRPVSLALEQRSQSKPGSSGLQSPAREGRRGCGCGCGCGRMQAVSVRTCCLFWSGWCCSPPARGHFWALFFWQTKTTPTGQRLGDNPMGHYAAQTLLLSFSPPITGHFRLRQAQSRREETTVSTPNLS